MMKGKKIAALAVTIMLVAMSFVVIAGLGWFGGAPKEACQEADEISSTNYQFSTEEDGTLTASNSANNFKVLVQDTEIEVTALDQETRDWQVELSLTAVGRDGIVIPVESASAELDGNKLELARGNVIEWYENDDRGLKQSFSIEVKPVAQVSELPLGLEMTILSDLHSRVINDGQGVLFATNEGRVILKYEELLVWDANDKELPAHLGLENDILTIFVDDSDAVYPITIDPLLYTEEAKLTASDGLAGDSFGFAVDICGNTAVVSAKGDDTLGTVAGSAYIFERTGTVWTEQVEIFGSDTAAGDNFGQDVAICGDTIVVGAWLNGGGGEGAAYVFVRSGTSWTQQAKLTASDAAFSDNFGYSVEIHQDTIIVGAINDDDINPNAGSAYIFHRTGTTWTQQGKLTAADCGPGDWFGYSVGISGDTATVGARYQDTFGTDSGGGYVFERSGTTWSLGSKLIATDAAAGDNFGDSVAIDGDTVIVGAYQPTIGNGAAYVFYKPGTGWPTNKTHDEKLVASDGALTDQFGTSVDIEGDIIVVGARLADVAAGDSGAAYVFKKESTGWTEIDKLNASDGAAYDWFGRDIAIKNGTIIVGAYHDDTYLGSAYVYVFDKLTTILDDLEALKDYINGLDPSAFSNANHQKTLINKINAVIKKVEDGDLDSICSAIDKLTNDLLKKTDGEHPPPDWITDPTAQQDVEDMILAIISDLQDVADSMGGCP